MIAKMSQQLEDKRTHHVHCQYGANEYFAYYKKHGGTLDRHQFGCILKDLNLAIAEQILSGYAFKMPARMGALVLTKRKEIVTIKDGKVVTNKRIDFKETLKMWAEFPETKEAKQVVRYLNKHTNGYIYSIAYNRGYATFTNKSVYSVQVNRYIKRKLAKNLFAGFEIEALVEKPRFNNGYELK